VSLDVYLYASETSTCEKCGHEQQVSSGGCVYDANITHNLGRMAQEAGIYLALWSPGEMKAPDQSKAIQALWRDKQYADARALEAKLPVVYASDLIPVLRDGLAKLKADPAHFEKFNAENGWGLYEHFVPFVERYLAACEANPLAIVRASR
jgi:hypothetical protein